MCLTCDHEFVEATTTYGEIDDEDIEEEFKTLQLELNSTKAVAAEAEISEETETDALSNALLNLRLKSEGAKKVEAECCTDENMSNERGLEAA